jgi:hypothetical protein
MNFADLTQEDQFFLIQQIQSIQQNIRYGSDGNPLIFEDSEEDLVEDNEAIELDEGSSPNHG